MDMEIDLVENIINKIKQESIFNFCDIYMDPALPASFHKLSVDDFYSFSCYIYDMIEKGNDPIRIRYTSDTHVVIPVQRTIKDWEHTIDVDGNDVTVTEQAMELSKLPNLGSNNIYYNNGITFEYDSITLNDIPTSSTYYYPL